MKSRFLTQLHVQLKDSSDGVWLVDAPLKYWSESLNGMVTVPPWFETEEPGPDIPPAFFETDFASVPRVPLFYSAWGDRAHREAVLHDYSFCIDGTISIYSEEARGENGYQAKGAKVILVRTLTFSEANNLFLEAMKSTGKGYFVRYGMYWGVVLGGWVFYHKRYVGDTL